MDKYRITVFLDNDYISNYDFIFSTTKSLVDNNGQGRKELTQEVNKRFTDWFSYDINKIL